MKDTIQNSVSLGLLMTLGLIFSLVTLSLLQVQSGTGQLARLIEITNRKAAAAGHMREAIRLRSDTLQAMRLTPDIFERDAEHLRFMDYAGKYRLARESLAGLGMDSGEIRIYGQLADLIRNAQPYIESAAELLMVQPAAVATAAAMGTAVYHQGQILELLDRLVELEHNKSLEAYAASRGHDRNIRRLAVTLAAIALCMSLLIAHLVMRRINGKKHLPGYRNARDSLTGLINRREFEARVERSIRHAKIQSATHTLLHLDVDRFKTVNDACGHSAGDELLRQVGRLLLSSMRKRDTLSRLGGDEFGILLENCPLDKAVEVADKLLRTMGDFRFTRGKTTFVLGFSIGVVALDRSTSCLASAMSAADSACYIAKESGRNRLQIAQPGDPRLQERHAQMQWVSRLRRALTENRFVLYFQPIIPCAGTTGHGKHIEILLRMIDDDGSVVAPGVFLPAAEKYNLATSIDRWVIENALAWLAAQDSRNHRPIMVCINLSGQSVCDPSMQKFIVDCVDKSGIAPEQLCFEITENAAAANVTAATGFMLNLHDRGFKFSLDDFGSGLSSFIYLKKLPVDYLKIDGAFIRDILSDPVDRAMVRSVSELGRLLGKKIIAEYVETLAIAEELKRLGINYVQGYAYAQPQALDDFEQIMGPRLVVISSR